MKTDEIPGSYEIEDSTENALAMMGKGYEKAAIIERPRTVHAIGDAGLEEYQVFGWVKMSAKFCKHIKKLRGAKISIWLCLALNIDQNGECGLTQKELCKMTGYSHTEVIASTKELDEMGFLSVDRSGKQNLYRPVFVAKGKGNSPLVKKLDSTPADSLESSPSDINSSPTSIKKKKESNLTKEEIQQANKKVDYILGNAAQAHAKIEVLGSFEVALGFSNLPWDATPEWRKLRDWVISACSENRSVFQTYQAWRKGDGKYQAMSNNKIRQSPQMFMDTGWPTFLAHSAMYGNKEPQYKPIPEDNNVYVKNPNPRNR